MHIVVEGFDGTGKSELCRRLSVATGWPVTHQAPYRPDSDEELRDTRVKALATTRRYCDLISNRWPDVTDYCYRSLRRPGDLETVITVLRASGVDQIIHCDVDSVDDLRIMARPWDLLDAELASRILPLAARTLNAYRVLMNNLKAAGMNVHRYVAIRNIEVD